jgi:hypothetical protein
MKWVIPCVNEQRLTGLHEVSCFVFKAGTNSDLGKLLRLCL